MTHEHNWRTEKDGWQECSCGAELSPLRVFDTSPPKRLQVQHDTGERKFEVAEIVPSPIFAHSAMMDQWAEFVADQEQKWGEERLPTNEN